MTTIRKNAHKQIEAILRAAVFIRVYHTDDNGDRSGQATPEQVIEVYRDGSFDRIRSEGGVTDFWVHRNYWFTAYESIEAAKRVLTPQAFEKYFPAQLATEPTFSDRRQVLITTLWNAIDELPAPEAAFAALCELFPDAFDDPRDPNSIRFAYANLKGGAA